MEVKNDYTHDSSVRNLDLNFGENDNSNKVIVAPPAIQNEIKYVDTQRRQYDKLRKKK